MKYTITKQEIQDGESRYTIHNLDVYSDDTDIEKLAKDEEEQANDLYESQDRGLRDYSVRVISEEEYNILRKYL
jgi:hypothetical protein